MDHLNTNIGTPRRASNEGDLPSGIGAQTRQGYSTYCELNNSTTTTNGFFLSSWEWNILKPFSVGSFNISNLTELCLSMSFLIFKTMISNAFFHKCYSIFAFKLVFEEDGATEVDKFVKSQNSILVIGSKGWVQTF